MLEQMDLDEVDFNYLKNEKIPGFFLNDRLEMILFVAYNRDNITGMWTNYENIVESYRILFSLLWKSYQK